MLPDEELLAVKQGLESDRVELKPSTSQSSSIRRAICAFANDLENRNESGFIFIGLNTDGSCAGIEDADRDQRKISDWALGGDILPRPDVEIAERELDGCRVIVVEIHPASEPPVRYQGTAWVRIGTTNRRASPEQEQRLTERRRAYHLPFDHRPAPEVELSQRNLDLEYFRLEYLPNAVAAEVLEQNRRALHEQLASLRFVTDDCPTYGAVLVLAHEPRAWIPGAYLQFIRIDGIELGDPVKDQKELSGNLPQMMMQLDELFDLHVQIAVDLESASREQRQPDYPVVALHQLVRNALIHRDYESSNAPVRLYWFDDRIQINNPGGLYGQVTAANFGQGITDYRNPLLAEAMHVLGFVQRFGYGVPLARRYLRENDNPAPEFQFEATYTSVTVRSAR